MSTRNSASLQLCLRLRCFGLVCRASQTTISLAEASAAYLGIVIAVCGCLLRSGASTKVDRLRDVSRWDRMLEQAFTGADWTLSSSASTRRGSSQPCTGQLDSVICGRWYAWGFDWREDTDLVSDWVSVWFQDVLEA